VREIELNSKQAGIRTRVVGELWMCESAMPQRRQSPASKSKLQILLLSLTVILLNSFGNLSLAFGLKQLPQHLGAHPLGYIRAMFHPFVAAGIALLILWLLMRMALMSWADLSFALPVTALGYVMGAVLGRTFLHEAVSPWQWGGTLLIFAGIMLVGTTPHRSSTREVRL
jgi:drug/metabolite transporter (DMT)-like permease